MKLIRSRLISQVGFGLVLVLLLGLQPGLSTAKPERGGQSASAGISFANGAFRQVWERPDLPVASGQASRSYTWGPEGWAFRGEPYAESQDGKRLVQYFDKTRMEITNSSADPAGTYFVTNGLLVTEMVSGRVQEGNTKFRETVAAQTPVAGDATGNPGPTYRSFQGVASLNLDHRSPQRLGEGVGATLDRVGTVGEDAALLGRYGVRIGQYDTRLGHNIPDVFWTFMNRVGPVYQNESFSDGPVINWLSTMGLPLTEAYWAQVMVGGQTRDVLIQLFERRVLTYTPANPAAFQVEMGNVGAHYYAWRYSGQARTAPWAVMQINNESSCGALSLSLSGQDQLRVEIPAQTIKTYRLGPGTYNYLATPALACEADPLRSSRSLGPNSQNEWKFNIR